MKAGFWLSFAAVGLLMMSSAVHEGRAPTKLHEGAWRRIAGHARQALRTQVIATLGLAPLTLVVFQQISLVGFVANLVAIPLVTLVITPLALLGMAAAPLWTVGAQVVQGLFAGLAWLAAWPAAVWFVPVAPGWAQLCALMGAAILMMRWPWPLKASALWLVLPLLDPPVPRPPHGSFELLAADIGQGTSVLVRTQAHLLVFDTGPTFGSASDAGSRVLLPLLHAMGEPRIDKLMLSHRDTDHVGGAASLLKGLPVREMQSSLEDDHPLRRLAQLPVRCEAGQAWDWDGVHFAVLHPPRTAYDESRKPNAMSCVLRVQSSAGASALLTGDIERRQELALVATEPAQLPSDVLIVPHHGSKTSSSDPFLDAVRPRVAVVQAGYRNRFNHPAADVVARYALREVPVIASPDCGAWRWRSDEPPTSGRCERDVRRRYWHFERQTDRDLVDNVH